MRRALSAVERRKRGSIAGFALLFRSLADYDEWDAEDLDEWVYRLYTGYIDTLRWDFPRARFGECSRAEFLTNMHNANRRYKTSVQLCRSLAYLERYIYFGALKAEEQRAFQRLRAYLIYREWRFQAVAGLSLLAEETTYRDCRFGLLPAPNEPRGWFRKSWVKSL